MSLTQEQLRVISKILNEVRESDSIFNAIEIDAQQDGKYNKKLKKALASYAPKVDSSEVLVLFDNTVFGSAKDGFVITHDYIYFKPQHEDSGRISLAVNNKISCDEKDVFYIGSEKINMILLYEKVSVIAEVVSKIVEFNCTLTKYELIEKTLGNVQYWLSTVCHDDNMEVYHGFEKVVKKYQSGKDINKIIIDLVDATEHIEDYDLPESIRYINEVYNIIEVEDIDHIDGLIRFAGSLVDYLKDRNRSLPYYEEAQRKISTVADAISLAESITVTYNDKAWAKKIYKKAEDLSGSYQEFYDTGVSAGNYFNDFARRNLMTAYEKIVQGSDYFKKEMLVEIAELVMDFGKDRENARKIIRTYLDQYATEFIDYKVAMTVVADEEYLNDTILSEEVFTNAKSLSESYSDRLLLLDDLTMEGDFNKQNRLDFAKEILGTTETEEQKQSFIDNMEDVLNDDLIKEVKASSVEVLRKKYASTANQGGDQFDEELELNMAKFDDLVDADTDQPAHTLDECFEWINKMKESVLTVDDPVRDFKDGDYGMAIEGLHDIMEDTEVDPATDDEYYASFCRHIELNENGRDTSEGGDQFDEELELNLPNFDDHVDADTDQPAHTLDECFEWINKMKKSVLTVDDPVRDFKDGDYGMAIEGLHDIMEDTEVDPATDDEYYASFCKHIKLNKNGRNDRDISAIEEAIPNSNKTNELVTELEHAAVESIPLQPSDLKAQYAQKIAAGEIDPVEVSFADFEEASKSREIDYKAVYSQMISEGRIDPVETTFDEMIKVSKLFGGIIESEYTATYSKYIGSGEIDPAETTYDEIVTIANIFNEINGGAVAAGAINKEELVKELQKYVDLIEDQGDKQYAQSQLDINYYWFFTDLGGDVLCSNYESIKRKVFQYYEHEDTTTSEMCRLIAERFQDELNDTESSIRVFKIAEGKIVDFEDAITIADDVAGGYANGDEEWARRVYQKARQKAVESSDPQYLVLLAISIASQDKLNDKEWASEILKEYESKASTFDELRLMLGCVIRDNHLNDQEWGERIVEKLRVRAESVNDYVKIISAVATTHKQLGIDLAKEAIELIENEDEKESLAHTAEYDLDDEDWTLRVDLEKLTIAELKSKYVKPTTEELKKLYADGVGDRSIDPVEISFDDFCENYAKF